MLVAHCPDQGNPIAAYHLCAWQGYFLGIQFRENWTNSIEIDSFARSTPNNHLEQARQALDKVSAESVAAKEPGMDGAWWNAGARTCTLLLQNRSLIVLDSCCWNNGYVSSLLHEPSYREPYVRGSGRRAGITPPPT